MNKKWTGKFFGGLLGFVLTGGQLYGLMAGIFIGHIIDNRSSGRIGGKAWGALLGMMFAGPLGAIAGVYLGHTIDKIDIKQGGVDPRAMFQINLISILAYMSKVDGHVDQKEVRAILGVFQKMGYGPAQMGIIERTLDFALRQPLNLQEICENFREASRYEERLMLLRIVYVVAMADGILHEAEQRAIQEIVYYLEIREEDVLSLKGEFTRSADHYYELLGLKRGATKQEVKKAYRNLALKCHPDRVAHLGEEYKKEAKEKFQKVVEAYEKVLKEVNHN